MGRPLYPAVCDPSDTGEKKHSAEQCVVCHFWCKKGEHTNAYMRTYLLIFLKSNNGRISQKPKIKKLPTRGEDNNENWNSLNAPYFIVLTYHGSTHNHKTQSIKFFLKTISKNGK